MNQAEAQIQAATQLANELEDSGHEEITALDVLDCLACAGLKLEVAAGEASEAYFALLEKTQTG